MSTLNTLMLALVRRSCSSSLGLLYPSVPREDLEQAPSHLALHLALSQSPNLKLKGS